MRTNHVFEINQKTILLFSLMGATLLFLNLLLVQQNRELKSPAGMLERSLLLKEGKELPAIEGLDVNGKRLKLGYGKDSRKTVILVFSPGCHACRQNMPNWQSLIKQLDKDVYRVVGISLRPEGINDYISEYGITDLTIIAEPEPKVRLAYSLVLTPQTLLISSDGRAEKVWTGVLEGDEKYDIEENLKCQLPGAE